MDDLQKLKLLTDETQSSNQSDAPATEPPCTGGCAAASGAGSRMFSDEDLAAILELHDGDVYAAAYDVLLRKARNSAVRISGGTELPDQRAYWLSRAKSVRPNGGKAAGRADGT